MTTLLEPTKRVVTDEEYQEAWTNRSNQAIMKKASESFGRTLEECDILSEQGVALWDALRGHDDAYGQRFTTSLYRFVQYRCINAVHSKKSLKSTIMTTLDGFDPETKPAAESSIDEDESRCVRECMKYLSREDREIIELIYFQSYTAEEAGVLMGYSKERARQRASHAVGRLKELCLDDV